MSDDAKKADVTEATAPAANDRMSAQPAPRAKVLSSRIALPAVAIIAGIAIGLGVMWTNRETLVGGSQADPITHTGDPADFGKKQAAPFPDDQAKRVPSEMNMTHGDSGTPIEPELASALDSELAALKADGPKFRTAADAVEAGYHFLEKKEGWDDHMFKRELYDDVFSPLEPEALILDEESNDHDTAIVALVYMVAGEEAPEGFVGSSDLWHNHPGLCISTDYKMLGHDLTEPYCEYLGGEYLGSHWMLHAWVLPGYENAGEPFVNYPAARQAARQ